MVIPITARRASQGPTTTTGGDHHFVSVAKRVEVPFYGDRVI